MFLRTQHGLRTVGVMREQRGVECLPNLAAVAGQRHVLLLVDSLQLGVEASDDGMLKAVGLNAGPVVDLIRRDVLDINRHVLRRVGVGAIGADGGHQLVVLVRNGDLRSLVADGVDAVVDGRTLGLVGRNAVGLEQLLDFIQQRFLGSIIRRTELLGALEHQVLEVVRQAGGFMRVVLAADLHGDIGLNARFLLADAHVNLQPIVQRVDTGFERVVRHALVLVLAASCGKHRYDDYRQKQ